MTTLDEFVKKDLLKKENKLFFLSVEVISKINKQTRFEKYRVSIIENQEQIDRLIYYPEGKPPIRTIDKDVLYILDTGKFIFEDVKEIARKVVNDWYCPISDRTTSKLVVNASHFSVYDLKNSNYEKISFNFTS